MVYQRVLQTQLKEPQNHLMGYRLRDLAVERKFSSTLSLAPLVWRLLLVLSAKIPIPADPADPAWPAASPRYWTFPTRPVMSNADEALRGSAIPNIDVALGGI